MLFYKTDVKGNLEKYVKFLTLRSQSCPSGPLWLNEIVRQCRSWTDLHMIEDQDEDIRVIARPWTNRLVDLVELVEGELVQLHQICLPIGQTNIGKGLVRDVYNTVIHHHHLLSTLPLLLHISITNHLPPLSWLPSRPSLSSTITTWFNLVDHHCHKYLIDHHCHHYRLDHHCRQYLVNYHCHQHLIDHHCHQESLPGRPSSQFSQRQKSS